MFEWIKNKFQGVKDHKEIDTTQQNYIDLGSFKSVKDAYVNPLTHTGQFAGNLASGGYYVFNPMTRNRVELEAAYRGSWVIGNIVDAIAEDMTREGIEITGLSGEEETDIKNAFYNYNIFEQLATCIKWGRLYGGALGVILIDGEDPELPLDVNRIRPGSFRGIHAVDRWEVTPDMTDLVDEFGVHLGAPRYYRFNDTYFLYSGRRIHYSRVIRFVGIQLPYYQKQWEIGWGESIVERIFSVVRAFDSATLGASQLVYQARLWVVGIKGYKKVLAGESDEARRGLDSHLEKMRLWRSNEGMTVIDSEDSINQHTYTFSGLDAILRELISQLAGSSGIPVTRLMGQSPAGFSTGDSELIQYYDRIRQKQNLELREALNKILHLMYVSLYNKELPALVTFDFKPLWTPTEKEQAEIFEMKSIPVMQAYGAGLIDDSIALDCLRNAGWNNITFEMIKEASRDDTPHIDENDDIIENRDMNYNDMLQSNNRLHDRTSHIISEN